MNFYWEQMRITDARKKGLSKEEINDKFGNKWDRQERLERDHWEKDKWDRQEDAERRKWED